MLFAEETTSSAGPVIGLSRAANRAPRWPVAGNLLGLLSCQQCSQVIARAFKDDRKVIGVASTKDASVSSPW